MAVYELSLPDSPDSVFTTLLDGVAYDLRLHWNGRDRSWQLYVARQNQQYSFKSKIKTNVDILAQYRSYPDCPKGAMIAIDNIKSYGRITRDGWSSGRWKLYYVTADTVEAIEDLNNSSDSVQITVDVTNETKFTKSGVPL